MPDPQTPNLDLYIPVRGADVDTWDVPANANFTQLDNIMGAVTSIALTNLNVTLSAAQYNCAFINLTGVLTGNIILTFPAKGRSYVVNNLTTGAFTITATTGLGISVVLPTSGAVQIYNDATNIKFADGSIKTTADTAETTAIAAGATAAVRVRAVVIQRFTSNGTYTPTAGMVYCTIECVGGGGGGGGSDGTSTTIAVGGTGGGGGSYAMTTTTAAAIGASKAVTIGAAGAAGLSAANGGAGGITSVGALCIANGGSGGIATSIAVLRAGGAGGTAGTGDVTVPGCPGGNAVWTGDNYGGWNFGGNAARGFGAGGQAPAVIDYADGTYTGVAGTGFGAGGSGGFSSYVATNAAGGAGTAGVVVITEFVA